MYMAYLPQGGKARFERSDLNRGFHAQWFSPRKGKLYDAHEASAAQDQQLSFVAPDQRDWVLILKAAHN